MYESFYHLSSKPFRLSPDPSFFYASAGHKRALSYLLYGLSQAEGFVVITGTPGTGKTTLAHKLLAEIDHNDMMVAHLSTTQVDAEDMLRMVAASFRLRSENVSKAGLIKDIESFLLAHAREHKRCLLVVDEAQNLPLRSLEELRMLSNFQVGNKALLQCFLLGQEQFRSMLDSPALEQMKQRIIANYHLLPLTSDETHAYVESRLTQCGWNDNPRFDPQAFTAIHGYTAGIPRRINMFCDRLLLLGYLEGLHVLTENTVDQVIAELNNEVIQKHSEIVFKPVHKPVDKVANAGGGQESDKARQKEERENINSAAVGSQTFATVPIFTHAPPLSAFGGRAEKMAQIQTAAVKSILASESASKPEIPATSEESPARKREEPTLNNHSERIPEVLAAIPMRPEEAKLAPAHWDMPPSLLPLTSPSLFQRAGLWIIGAVVLLLVGGIFIWSYFEQTDSLAKTWPASQISQEIEAKTLSSPPLADPLNDPSENVLTENRMLDTTPRPPGTPSPSMGAAASQEEPLKTVPATTAVESPASPLGASEKSGRKEKSGSASITSSSAAVPATSGMQESPLARIDTAQEPARESKTGKNRANTLGMAAPSPLAESLPAAPGTEVASASPMPAAPASNREPGVETAIMPTDLAQLLLKFTVAYEEGNLNQFITLFDPEARTEDHSNRNDIRKDYEDLFRRTSVRKIVLGDIHWNPGAQVAEGKGSFEVRIKQPQEADLRIYRGELTLNVQKEAAGVFITGMFHKYARNSQ